MQHSSRTCDLFTTVPSLSILILLESKVGREHYLRTLSPHGLNTDYDVKCFRVPLFIGYLDKVA